MTFVEDLKLGKDAEGVVRKLYKDCGFEVFEVSRECRKFYDVVAAGHNLLFMTEVKFDDYEKKSGNIAIEIANSQTQQDSGLSITKAHFWIQALNSGIWITTTAKLRSYLKTHKPKRVIDKAGDGNATLWLYDSAKIRQEIFTNLGELDAEEIVRFLKEGLDGQVSS